MFQHSSSIGYLSIVFIVLCVHFTNSRKLPSYIQVCKKSDPNFDQCLLDSIEAVRPHLPKGIPKLRVPPIEPLYIPQLDINRDLENLKVKASLREIKIYGASSFQIKNIRANVDKLTVESTILIPHVYVTSEYDVDGRLLIVPLKGKGLFKGNFTDIVADIRSSGEIATNSKGVKHFVIKTISTKIKVGDQAAKFINTDNNRGNALITETAAAFIDQNRRQVLDIVTPIAQETAEAFIKQLGNSILKSIPYTELLPE